MRERIEHIVANAVNAPSGENAQPWQFAIHENQLDIFNIPERDQSLYNFGQRGSYVAHGALLENIIITARTLGCMATVALFPDSTQANLVARVSFSVAMPVPDPLYPYIVERATNRKPYKKIALTQEQKAELLSAAGSIAGGELKLADNLDEVKALALVGSMNERIVFENELLHQFLFSHITWTKAEAEQKSIGFYIKTLGMPAPAELSFKLFRHWPVVRALNRVGLSKAIWKQNGNTYAQSAAMGIVVVPGVTPTDFVTAGRITQRVWLTATKLGISLHPMTCVLFFMQRIQAGQGHEFSSDQRDNIQQSFEQVKKVFHVTQGTIPMMFRLGFGGNPDARSPKLPPDIISES